MTTHRLFRVKEQNVEMSQSLKLKQTVRYLLRYYSPVASADDVISVYCANSKEKRATRND